MLGGAAPVGAREGEFFDGCAGLGAPAGVAFWISRSCDMKLEIVLDNSSVVALFAVLIAVCSAIKSRNIDVVSSDAARGVASFLNAVISARSSSFCLVIFSISSDKAVRRSSVDAAGAVALACGASRSPRTVASSMVNCATCAESCWICSDVCVAAGVGEAVGSGALCNLASAAVIAILTTFTARVAFLQALHVTIGGTLELGVRDRVPHVGV